MFQNYRKYFRNKARYFTARISSNNPWERGRLARIFLKNAGIMPAFQAKNEVFGACLELMRTVKYRALLLKYFL